MTGSIRRRSFSDLRVSTLWDFKGHSSIEFTDDDLILVGPVAYYRFHDGANVKGYNVLIRNFYGYVAETFLQNSTVLIQEAPSESSSTEMRCTL